MRPRHVPSTPALVQGSAVIDRGLPGTAHQHSGNASRRIRVVAREATISTGEVWWAVRCLIKYVEGHALLGVLRCQLDETAADPADRHRIVEEERSGVIPPDPDRLNTISRKHRDL